MSKQKLVFITASLLLSLSVIFAGCSGAGIGGKASSGSSTTVISGKVTLSGTILGSSKASYFKALSTAPTGKPGTAKFSDKAWSSLKAAASYGSNTLMSAFDNSLLADATVDLYDADHPEWLFPIATGTTNGDGTYTLSSMTNASKNTGADYTDGSPIPAGKYTLVAHKEKLGQKPLVAVQTLVKEFAGEVPNIDFEVLPSDVAPSVISMFGAPKNTDGTQTWGGANRTLPANAAIQITFSMPMVRETLSAIDIKPTAKVPTGRWSLSADWLTATYYVDADQHLISGTTYTITIYGADDSSGQHSHVANVYGNSINDTAIGSFTAMAEDHLSPTVQWNSPSVIQMGSPVDVTQSFRIEANELLDVNGITLVGSPSLGAKPGVIYSGKNANGMYVYEFVLGDPLKLGTTYNLKVSGGKDLAGNQMNELTGSITTNDAANTPGISVTDSSGNPASPDFQELQAEVKSVFGKWVRALNDRNLAQFQSLMTGDFYMENDPSKGIDGETDINRDGRLSLAEFSNMLSIRAFPQWDYCGTTMTGNIIGSINVIAATKSADFEFALSATNVMKSAQCGDAAPKNHLFMTAKFVNGAWKIVRASEGIDTRDKSISSPGLVTTHLYQSAWPYLSSSEINDGGMLSSLPNTVTDSSHMLKAKFSWDAVPGVSSYVLVIVNARNPQQVAAIAFPSTVTSAASDDVWIGPSGLGGVNITSKFGGNGGPANPESGVWNGKNYVEGGRYYWEVIGLGTTSATTNDPDNDSSYVMKKKISEILKDITVTSTVKNFSVAGVFKELYVQVRAGTSLTSTPLTYSENVGGYDAGGAFRVTLSVATPNLISDPTTTRGWISVQGSSNANFGFNFDSSGLANQTIVLYKGWNQINVCDQGDNSANPPSQSLCKSFRILTTGGIPPTISVWDVTDDIGNTLIGDAWNYYTTSNGATKVTIGGGVSDPQVNRLQLYVGGESGAYSSMYVPVITDNAGNHVYTVTTEVYKGNNWLSINSSGGMNNYYTQLGVYTDTGSVWVPPVAINSISSAVKTNDYSWSSDWTATPSGPDYTVTISGKFKVPKNGSYSVWSDGANAGGTIYALADGSFSLPVTLYTSDPVKGTWNYVNIGAKDADGNLYAWYNLNILTKTGKPVIKPQITNINGSAYDPAAANSTFNTSACLVNIAGTAQQGPVQVNWSSYDGSQSHYESYTIMADAGNHFAFSMPVVGGGNSYNYINIYDQNWRGTNVNVLTSGSCAYTYPSTTVTSVKDASGNVLSDMGGYYYDAGTSNSVTVSGTTNRPGSTITASVWVCNGQQLYQATTSGNTWTISGINVYGVVGTNGINIYDGYNGYYMNVYSSNAQTPPPPPLQATITTAGALQTQSGCGYTYWDVGAATTVTISGTTTATDGTGNYTDPVGGYHTFQIVSGAFTISGIPVYQGTNNIYLYDTAWHNINFNVTSSNGVSMPHFVTLTSPVHNDVVSAGAIAVSGMTQDVTGTGFAADKVTAQIYNSNNGSYTYFSSDPADSSWNLPLTFDKNTGAFSFSYDFGPGMYYSSISINAYDSTMGVSHSANIYVNNLYGYGDYYSKPRAKTGKVDSRAAILTEEFLKHNLMTNQ